VDIFDGLHMGVISGRLPGSEPRTNGDYDAAVNLTCTETVADPPRATFGASRAVGASLLSR
jgi:hypothetical protein